MKKSLKILFINGIFILCCTSSAIKAYQVNLSFDSLFPKTWYQKGLESSMHVWQSLINVFEKRTFLPKSKEYTPDILICKLLNDNHDSYINQQIIMFIGNLYGTLLYSFLNLPKSYNKTLTSRKKIIENS